MGSKWKSRVTTEKLAELGYSNYRQYLASEHWKDVRRRFYKSRLVTRSPSGRPCCAACLQDDRPLDLHHQTYKRLGKEYLRDFVLLCHECHEGAHAHYKKDKRSGLWGASRHIVKKAERERKRKGQTQAER